MGRRRKPPEMDTATHQQLQGAIAALARSGAVSYFFDLRRRRQGTQLWQYFKKGLPVDQIDDIAEYCYKEGGDDWEYKIKVRDAAGNYAVLPDGTQLQESTIPSLNAPPPDPSKMPDDPILEGRRKEIDLQRQELFLQEQQAQLDRQRKRIEKLKKGEDDDDDEDDDRIPPGHVYHPQYGIIPMPGMMGGGMGGYNPYLPPWMQQRKEEKSDLATLLPIVMNGLEKIADKLGGKSSTLDDLAKLKTAGLLGGDQKPLEPKDMLAMFAPFVTEMGKISTEGNKVLMQNLAESDRAFREKVLDLLMASGAGDDEIDKWKKILNLATDTVGNGIKLVFGRQTVVKGDGKKVEVPVVKKPTAPGLPQAKTEEGKKPGEKVDAAAEAKRVVGERVHLFLATQEQEMLVGSEPGWIAEKLDELWFGLPEAIRTKILESKVEEIYNLLREYDAETVDRILGAVGADESGAHKKWCVDFWRSIKAPPEEEVDDGGDDDDDSGGGDDDTPPPEEPPPDDGTGKEEPAPKEEATA